MHKYTQSEWNDIYLKHRQSIFDGEYEEPLVIERGDFSEVDLNGRNITGIVFRDCKF